MGQLLEKPDSVVKQSKEPYRNFLKDMPLFADFPYDSISLVLHNSIFKKYNKDKLLFLTGDEADFFYIIISGWIKLFRETRDGHEAVIAVLTSRGVFGQSAIAKKGYYSYSAEAASDLSVLQISSSFM